jgi:kexin
VNGFTGRFVNWRLNLWGEAVDGSHQPLHPLPDGYGGGVTEVATITAPIPISTPTETDKANSPEGLVNVNSFTTGETVPIPATSSRDTALRHNFSTYSVHAHAFIITATLSMIIFCSAIGFCLCASRLRVHERSLYEQLEMRNTGRYPGQLRRHDIDSYRSSSETDNEQIPRQ